MDVGTLPGMGTDAAGTSRAADGGYGDSGGYEGSGSSGSSQGGTNPLGGSGSGSGSGTSTTGSGGTEPPTAGDLGIDPNSGAYIDATIGLRRNLPTTQRVLYRVSDVGNDFLPPGLYILQEIVNIFLDAL